jgi:dipeptidyl aminopeptidase/acylaminoacyl peptidase
MIVFHLVLSAAVIAAPPPSVAGPVPPSPDLYRMPPEEIAKLADAPLTPSLNVGPDEDWALLERRPTLLPLTEAAQPELKLAGIRFSPQNSDQTRQPYAQKLWLLQISTRTERSITGIPDGLKARWASWSPDGKRIAFGLSTDRAVELWIVDVPSGMAKKIPNLQLQGVHPNAPFHWRSDSESLVCRTVVADRGPPPPQPRLPSGPVIDESIAGRSAPSRTYQDLLKNSYDADLFAYYAQAQVQKVSIDGRIDSLGKPALVVRAEPSPNGEFILVESLHRPFSYLVPEERFPRTVEVWTVKGKSVRTLADLPLADQVPLSFDAVPTGPRRFGWRADSAATLYWVEAQDGGDPRADAPIRDRLFALAAPFAGAPVSLASLQMRFRSVEWGDDKLALLSEGRWKDRRIRTWRFSPSSPEAKPQLIVERSSEDRYRDPGRAAMRPTPRGTSVLQTASQDQALFLIGPGASPEGDRPFVDRLDLRSLAATRLWQSEAPYYEEPIHVFADDGARLLTRREAVAEPPNYQLRDLTQKTLQPLTRIPHPAPQLASVRTELVRYQRSDGVKLTATLYLPPNYSRQAGPLPMLMWAYPQEFKSADAAGQVTTSPYRFVRVSPMSPLFWLVRGYAIFDNPSFPILGEGSHEANDTYVQQLVDDAKAAVNEVVRLGVADRNRIAIGGHSYGAFTTANLLAHTDLFRAGIARSGAYNRTLTPFGFQREERTFWDAPQLYVEMSPFTYANKIERPLLLIHGMEDNNSGTFPLQSERLFQALKGFGKPSRLVLLPHEAHGYRARESVMHMLWEMDQWLEKHVKNAPRGKLAQSGGAN